MTDSNIHLSENEYRKLISKFDETQVKKKIGEYEEKKKRYFAENDLDKRKQIFRKVPQSDYRSISQSLSTEGMKEVQPIRDREKIEEMKNVLKRHTYRDYFLFVMGVNTGYRISDLLSMRLSDVRGKTHVSIKEQKTRNSTGKIRRLMLHPGLHPEIEEYVKIMRISDDDYLFPSRKGDKPISRVQAYRILNKAAKEIELEEIGTHTLRKTFGYHYYQKYKDVAHLQSLFGHSAPIITLRYIGIHQDTLDKSIADMDLL